jgi:membrane protein
MRTGEGMTDEEPQQKGTTDGTTVARTRRERVQARVARLKQESSVVLSDLEKIRPQSRTVSAGFFIFERDQEFPTSLLTGALAARLVIFLIPFLMLFIFLIGFGADLAKLTAAEAAGEMGIPGMFAQAAEESGAAAGTIRFAGVLFTAFATVWAANGLGRTMRLATSVVWRTPRISVKRRWLIPLIVIAFALAVLAITMASNRLDEPGYADDLVRLLFELLVVAGFWLVASRFLPSDPEANRWRDFVPGAILMGIAVIGLKAAMVVYLVPKWATLSERYGDIGIVLVMLSFAYLVGFATVGSAHVNSAMFHTRRDPSRVSPQGRNWPLLDLLKAERETLSDDRTD